MNDDLNSLQSVNYKHADNKISIFLLRYSQTTVLVAVGNLEKLINNYILSDKEN